jgi:GMP synthase (glutamine-hydrolysing)
MAICYGQQTLATQLGGRVEGGHAREFGRADVEIRKPSALYEGVWQVGGKYPVWMSHGDRVVEAPAGFEIVGVSENAPFAIATDEKRKYYTTMFHPEVVHTPDGAKLLSNFVHRVVGLKSDWSMSAYRQNMIDQIRRQVGKGKVICALSGGVDLSVAALLIHEAVGDQLTCILVDHGLMRKDEAKSVVAMFREHYNLPLILVDASDRFISALEGESDPKRNARRLAGSSSKCSRRKQKTRWGRFPRPGHALPRCDRERVLHRRPVGNHQVASQCRRSARSHEHEAGGTAA